MTRKTEVLLVLILLLGVFSAAWQLAIKASNEPLQRNMTLVVDTFEVESYGADAGRLWSGLVANGVRAAIVRSADEAHRLPPEVQPIAMVDDLTWEAWKTSGFQPAGVVFTFNTSPASLEEIRKVFPTQPLGFFEFNQKYFFYENAKELIGNTWRIYDRPARPTNRFQNEFSISVLERQTELTVVRMLWNNSVDVNLQRVVAIHDAIVTGGHTIGSLPVPRASFPQPDWVLWGMALALGGAVGLGAVYAWGSRLPRWVPLAGPVAGIVGFFAAQMVLNPVLLRQLLSLSAAIVYPSVGFLGWWRFAKREQPQVAAISRVYKQFAVMAAFAYAGGLSVHAFLAQPIFQLGFTQFMGIKLGYLVPLGLAAAIIGWYVAQDVRRHPESYLNKRRTKQAIALAVLAFIGAIFILLTRTGNTPVIPVPSFELTFRDELFKLFWARPRTKEFLGYPVLMVGLLLWHKRELLYGGLGILVGYIGILSMVNTFEHLHHPILLELARGAIGLTLGLLISLPAVWLVNKYAYLLKGYAKP